MLEQNIWTKKLLKARRMKFSKTLESFFLITVGEDFIQKKNEKEKSKLFLLVLVT